MTRITLEQTQAMHRYYLEGHSLRETGQKFYFSQQHILYYFRRYGLKTRTPSQAGWLIRCNPHRHAETQVMYADYQTGMTMAAVAEKYNYSTQAVYNRFRRAGLPRRPRHNHERQTQSVVSRDCVQPLLSGTDRSGQGHS